MSGGAASKGAPESTTREGIAGVTTSANGEPTAPRPSSTEQSTGTPHAGAGATSAGQHTGSTAALSEHVGITMSPGLLEQMAHEGIAIIVTRPEFIRIVRPGEDA